LFVVISSFSLPKNLDFFNISLDGHAKIRGESLMISAALSLDEPEFDNILVFGTLGVNLLVTLFLKKLLLLSVSIIFQLNS